MDNFTLEYALLLANLTFWAMEMRFILSKNLVMTVGELGPVEIELLLSVVLFFSGLFGVDSLQRPLGDIVDLSGFSWLSEVRCSVVLGLVLILK